MSEGTMTATSDDNGVNNPSTQTGENNEVVSQRVFQERVSKLSGQKNELSSQLQNALDENTRMKSEQEEAKHNKQMQNEEYVQVIDDLKKNIDTLTPFKSQWETYETSKREAEMGKLSDSQKEIAEGMELLKLEKYVESVVQSTDAIQGKMSTERQGVQQTEEFGGYGSMIEWVSKDPLSYEKAKTARSGGDDKFGNIFGV